MTYVKRVILGAVRRAGYEIRKVENASAAGSVAVAPAPLTSPHALAARDYLEVLYEKKPTTERLKDWSVLRGHLLSKTTFVEGLDLLRQELTLQNAALFADAVIERMPYRPSLRC